MNKLLMTLHRVLGTVLSLFFALWFLSGFVMIYHSFPRITEVERTRALPTIERPADTALDSLVQTLERYGALRGASLRVGEDGSWIVDYRAVEGERGYLHERLGRIERLAGAEREGYARRFATEPIARIDTLTDLDQWIPFERMMSEMPIYRYSYADDEDTKLYISGISAEGVQLTTHSTRFWAWLGAIPHWLYLCELRRHAGVWQSVVVWVSGIGTLMALCGLLVGLRVWWRGRKSRGLSPYSKRSYRWHHVLGYIFGVFVCGFVFSGMMSMVEVPRWLVSVENENISRAIRSNPICMPPSDFPLRCGDVLEAYRGKVKRLHWSSFGQVPLYALDLVDGERLVLRADGSEVEPLELSRMEVESRIQSLYQEPVPLSIELLQEQDNYYLGKDQAPALPVYRVVADDPDGSCYYINPKTGDSRYLNRNARVRKWLYQALHSFSIKWLVERPVLWNLLMWMVLTAGTIISLTGVWLSVRYVSRKLCRRCR